MNTKILLVWLSFAARTLIQDVILFLDLVHCSGLVLGLAQGQIRDLFQCLVLVLPDKIVTWSLGISFDVSWSLWSLHFRSIPLIPLRVFE